MCAAHPHTFRRGSFGKGAVSGGVTRRVPLTMRERRGGARHDGIIDPGGRRGRPPFLSGGWKSIDRGSIVSSRQGYIAKAA
jgi:hypothetical protein